jgi:hypothetical protein
MPLVLTVGSNNVSLSATNSCGTDTKTTVINYQPCSIPQVIYNMDANGHTTNQSIFTYNAQILDYSGNMTVTLSMNGELLTGFSNNLGNILAEISLNPGLNNLTITVTNDCGTLTDTYLVTYDGSGGEGIITNPSGNKQTPATPRPVAPKPTPAPVTPKSDAPKPTPPATAPKPTPAATPTKPETPKPSAPEATPKPKPNNENTNTKGGGR